MNDINTDAEGTTMADASSSTTPNAGPATRAPNPQVALAIGDVINERSLRLFERTVWSRVEDASEESRKTGNAEALAPAARGLLIGLPKGTPAADIQRALADAEKRVKGAEAVITAPLQAAHQSWTALSKGRGSKSDDPRVQTQLAAAFGTASATLHKAEGEAERGGGAPIQFVLAGQAAQEWARNASRLAELEEASRRPGGVGLGELPSGLVAAGLDVLADRTGRIERVFKETRDWLSKGTDDIRYATQVLSQVERPDLLDLQEDDRIAKLLQASEGRMQAEQSLREASSNSQSALQALNLGQPCEEYLQGKSTSRQFASAITRALGENAQTGPEKVRDVIHAAVATLAASDQFREAARDALTPLRQAQAIRVAVPDGLDSGPVLTIQARGDLKIDRVSNLGPGDPLLRVAFNHLAQHQTGLRELKQISNHNPDDALEPKAVPILESQRQAANILLLAIEQTALEENQRLAGLDGSSRRVALSQDVMPTITLMDDREIPVINLTDKKAIKAVEAMVNAGETGRNIADLESSQILALGAAAAAANAEISVAFRHAGQSTQPLRTNNIVAIAALEHLAQHKSRYDLGTELQNTTQAERSHADEVRKRLRSITTRSFENRQDQRAFNVDMPEAVKVPPLVAAARATGVDAAVKDALMTGSPRAAAGIEALAKATADNKELYIVDVGPGGLSADERAMLNAAAAETQQTISVLLKAPDGSHRRLDTDPDGQMHEADAAFRSSLSDAITPNLIIPVSPAAPSFNINPDGRISQSSPQSPVEKGMRLVTIAPDGVGRAAPVFSVNETEMDGVENKSAVMLGSNQKRVRFLVDQDGRLNAIAAADAAPAAMSLDPVAMRREAGLPDEPLPAAPRLDPRASVPRGPDANSHEQHQAVDGILELRRIGIAEGGRAQLIQASFGTRTPDVVATLPQVLPDALPLHRLPGRQDTFIVANGSAHWPDREEQLILIQRLSEAQNGFRPGMLPTEIGLAWQPVLSSVADRLGRPVSVIIQTDDQISPVVLFHGRNRSGELSITEVKTPKTLGQVVEREEIAERYRIGKLSGTKKIEPDELTARTKAELYEPLALAAKESGRAIVAILGTEEGRSHPSFRVAPDGRTTISWRTLPVRDPDLGPAPYVDVATLASEKTSGITGLEGAMSQKEFRDLTRAEKGERSAEGLVIVDRSSVIAPTDRLIPTAQMIMAEDSSSAIESGAKGKASGDSITIVPDEHDHVAHLAEHLVGMTANNSTFAMQLAQAGEMLGKNGTVVADTAREAAVYRAAMIAAAPFKPEIKTVLDEEAYARSLASKGGNGIEDRIIDGPANRIETADLVAMLHLAENGVDNGQRRAKLSDILVGPKNNEETSALTEAGWRMGLDTLGSESAARNTGLALTTQNPIEQMEINGVAHRVVPVTGEENTVRAINTLFDAAAVSGRDVKVVLKHEDGSLEAATFKPDFSYETKDITLSPDEAHSHKNLAYARVGETVPLVITPNRELIPDPREEARAAEMSSSRLAEGVLLDISESIRASLNNLQRTGILPENATISEFERESRRPSPIAATFDRAEVVRISGTTDGRKPEMSMVKIGGSVTLVGPSGSTEANKVEGQTLIDLAERSEIRRIPADEVANILAAREPTVRVAARSGKESAMTIDERKTAPALTQEAR